MTTTTNIRFLKDYKITFYSFPGAANYSGGFNAAEFAAFPSDFAATLIASGVAVAVDSLPSPPAPPAVVLLRVQKPLTYQHCDYEVGDVGGFVQPFADALIASGQATAA